MAFSLLLATDLLLLAGGSRVIFTLLLPFCGLVASFRWLLLLGGGFDWVAFGLLFFLVASYYGPLPPFVGP
jgi:hypothetical protein